MQPARLSALTIRLVEYDMQLSTQELLLVASVFEDSGITLIQSRQRMPNTLDLGVPGRIGIKYFA
jgi:hypothetical protein